jgi:hypothetical protein
VIAADCTADPGASGSDSHPGQATLRCGCVADLTSEKRRKYYQRDIESIE